MVFLFFFNFILMDFFVYFGVCVCFDIFIINFIYPFAFIFSFVFFSHLHLC